MQKLYHGEEKKMAKLALNIYRSLKANKVRFLALAAIIGIGITTWNGMIMSFTNLSTTYNAAFEQQAMASFTIQTANPSGTGDDAWIDYNNLTTFINDYNEKHNTPIEKFELRIVYDLTFNIRGNKQNGRIIGFQTFDSEGNFNPYPDVNSYRLLEGRGNGFDETSRYRNVTLLEAHLADHWNLMEGDFLGVGKNSVAFQVQGVIGSPEYLLNSGSYADILPSPRRFGVIFVPLQSAQQLVGVTNKVNEVSVLIKNDHSLYEREKVAEEFKNYLESEHDLKLSEAIDRDNQVSYYLLRLDMEEAREMGYALPIILLVMAMAGLYVLLQRMVTAERKDIAVSQALGYSRRFIIMQYMGIAIVVSIIGTAIGTLIGYLFADQFIPLYVNAIGIKFPSTVQVDWIVVILGIILGLFTGFVGGFLPVRKAIQPIPAESLRFDPSLHITSGKIPLLERILNKLHVNLKVTGLRFPLRNFFRSKRRTFSSVLGVVIAVSLIGMGFGMAESMQTAVVNQYEVFEDWDLKVDYSEIPTNTESIITELNSLSGVASTYHLTSGATLTSEKSNIEKTVQLIGLKNSNGYLGHNFYFEDGFYDPEGVVLSLPVAKKLNIGVGDQINLEIANLTNLVSIVPFRAHFELVNVSLEVSGIVDEFNGLVAYIDLENMASLSSFPGEPANSVVLKINDPTSERIEEVRSFIYENLGENVRLVSTKSETAGDLIGLLNILYYLMYVLAAFSVLLAVAMVYNTVYINLEERKREMATLLTIGTPGRKIISSVTLENTIVTIIGTFFGIILGYLLLFFFMEVIIDMEFFRIKTFISNDTILISFFMTLFGVYFAQYFPLKRILNLNLAEATKERVV
jgi:putative ABC transport system permease protein